MNDSIIKTVAKSIGAVAGACALGFVFEMILGLLCFWFLDLGIFWYMAIGTILLPIILAPIYGTIYLSSLFKNRIAEIIFCVIVALWLLIAVINMGIFIFQNNPSDGERFIAITFLLAMAFDILALLFSPFAHINKDN